MSAREYWVAYRHARLWGKTVKTSIRYARERVELDRRERDKTRPSPRPPASKSHAGPV